MGRSPDCLHPRTNLPFFDGLYRLIYGYLQSIDNSSRIQMMKNPIKLFILVSVLCGSAVLAQIVDPQNVLIRNVYLVQQDPAEDRALVNILIRDNKLEIVTEDDIPAKDIAMAVDGREGYVLGNLAVGETPNFIKMLQTIHKNLILSIINLKFDNMSYPTFLYF